AIERGGMAARADALAPRLDADELDAGLVDVRMEDADRVRAAAHAGDDDVGLPAHQLRHLPAALLADHALEVAHHRGIRMRPGNRADDVEGGVDVGDPVAHRL